MDNPIKAAGTLLLVDDEPYIRELASIVLEQNGYRVVLADGGPEALQLYTQHIDLVILDYALPDLDGLALLKRMRAFTRSHPVVMLTSHNEHWLKEEACRSGVNYLIQKTAVGSFLTKLGDIVAQELGLRKKSTPPSLMGVRDFTAFLQSSIN